MSYLYHGKEYPNREAMVIAIIERLKASGRIK